MLQLENSLGGVAGEALGAEKTFDISNVGGGAFGPGWDFIHYVRFGTFKDIFVKQLFILEDKKKQLK